MLTRDQEYAKKAYAHVNSVKKDQGEKAQKSYGAMSHKLPILIHHAGLIQALAFVDARGKLIHHQLLSDLAETLGYEDRKEFYDLARTGDLMSYIHLTQQALAALLWYKRFAQSILGIDASTAADDENAGEEK